jgi:hypothetical protein
MPVDAAVVGLEDLPMDVFDVVDSKARLLTADVTGSNMPTAFICTGHDCFDGFSE